MRVSRFSSSRTRLPRLLLLSPTLFIPAFPLATRARPTDTTFSVRSERHRDCSTLSLSLSLSHVSPARSFTDISLPLFSTPSLPPFPWLPLSCQETFDLLSSSFFPSPNALFARSYHGTLSHLPSLSSYQFPFSSISSFIPLPIGIRASLSVTRRNSLSLALALHRGPLSQPGPHSPTSLPPSPHLSRRLASPAFPLRHLPRAILPPSTRLAHPAVVSLRYSPFCPRGTSNAEAQVCKMAAACWSLNATKTLLCFDESEEDAVRKREGEGEKERMRERERQVSERGRRRKQKNEGKR